MPEKFGSGSGEQFLNEKYSGLQKSEEVESASRRQEIQQEKKPKNKNEKVGVYLERVEEMFNHPDKAIRDRSVRYVKHKLHDRFVIKETDIPEEAFLLEQRIAREQGHGTIEITDEFREKKAEEIINNQTQKLDQWIDYLSSSDAQYPNWAKYWVFRSLVKMGKLEKKTDEKGEEIVNFKNRTKDTVAAFPTLNPRALAMAIGVVRARIEDKQKPKKERQPVENKSIKLKDDEFQKLLSTEDFSKVYTQFLVEIPEYSIEGLKETRGSWITYPKNSNPTKLVKSLEGYSLEWCTANFDTAKTQLEGGDFYVYYSLDETGKPVIPRLAIRMEG